MNSLRTAARLLIKSLTNNCLLEIYVLRGALTDGGAQAARQS